MTTAEGYKSLYTVINLSSLSDDCILKIQSLLGADFSDIHSYTYDGSVGGLDIWNTIPHFFSDYATPLFFVVDSFTQLGNNTTWRRFRATDMDVICDAEGNIIPFTDAPIISEHTQNTCKLCGGEYDFRKVQISETLGEVSISLSGNLQRIAEESKFKFCPECGRKLTSENFMKKSQ